MQRVLTFMLTLILVATPLRAMAQAAPDAPDPAGQLPVPPLRQGMVQDESSQPLPAAERQQLEQALGSFTSGLRFKVLLVDNGGPQPWPALPDAVREAWQLPDKTILFVVATRDQYRIRFYFYPWVNGTGVTPEYTTDAILNVYRPLVNQDRLADALIALAAELDRLAGGTGVPAAAPADAPAAAPTDPPVAETRSQPEPAESGAPEATAPPPGPAPPASQPLPTWVLGAMGMLLVGVALGWGLAGRRAPRTRRTHRHRSL